MHLLEATERIAAEIIEGVEVSWRFDFPCEQELCPFDMPAAHFFNECAQQLRSYYVAPKDSSAGDGVLHEAFRCLREAMRGGNALRIAIGCRKEDRGKHFVRVLVERHGKPLLACDRQWYGGDATFAGYHLCVAVLSIARHLASLNASLAVAPPNRPDR